MPFKSEAQRRYLFARHPKLAEKWAHKYGTPKNLPKHKSNDYIRKNLKFVKHIEIKGEIPLLTSEIGLILGVAEYEGKTYYFCAQHCKDSFLKEPEKYIKKR